MPESDINTIRYMLDGIKNILDKNGAHLERTPDGIRIATRESIAETIIPKITEVA